MATFKVGQRVRVIDQAAESVIFFGSRLQREATISAIPFHIGDCAIRFDDDPRDWYANFNQLSPLTDPRASEFIADMERYAHIAQKKREPA